MNKKRILLINRGHSHNLGDRAIKESLKNLIQSAGYEVIFHDFTEGKYKNPYESLSDKSQINGGFKRTLYKFIPAKLKWYLRNRHMFSKDILNESYDHVIIGGGQLINNNVQFPLAMYLWTNKLA